jgi:hypothetical protein
MPANKDFKRLVRARMRKTGESYTAARLQVLNRKPSTLHREPATVPAAVVASTNYAALAGMSDEAVKAKTGCTWERWVTALDYYGAHAWSHRAIADFVHEKYKVPSWWTQTVTVGYERIKGLRDRGQQRDGRYEATKSKVFGVPLGRLYRAFADKRTRSRWLPAVNFTVRTATINKSMRITWADGTSVELGFMAKGDAKAQVQIQHRRLADKAGAAKMKQFWEERLAALEEQLLPASARRRTA